MNTKLKYLIGGLALLVCAASPAIAQQRDCAYDRSQTVAGLVGNQSSDAYRRKAQSDTTYATCSCASIQRQRTAEAMSNLPQTPESELRRRNLAEQYNSCIEVNIQIAQQRRQAQEAPPLPQSSTRSLPQTQQSSSHQFDTLKTWYITAAGGWVVFDDKSEVTLPNYSGTGREQESGYFADVRTGFSIGKSFVDLNGSFVKLSGHLDVPSLNNYIGMDKQSTALEPRLLLNIIGPLNVFGMYRKQWDAYRQDVLKSGNGLPLGVTNSEQTTNLFGGGLALGTARIHGWLGYQERRITWDGGSENMSGGEIGFRLNNLMQHNKKRSNFEIRARYLSNPYYSQYVPQRYGYIEVESVLQGFENNIGVIVGAKYWKTTGGNPDVKEHSFTLSAGVSLRL